MNGPWIRRCCALTKRGSFRTVSHEDQAHIFSELRLQRAVSVKKIENAFFPDQPASIEKKTLRQAQRLAICRRSLANHFRSICEEIGVNRVRCGKYQFLRNATISQIIKR